MRASKSLLAAPPVTSPDAPASRNPEELAGPSETRSLDRRQIYVGEGFSVRLVGRSGVASGEAIDLTPEGMGVAIVGGESCFEPGETIIVEHTGKVTAGLEHHAIVRNVGEGRYIGKSVPRLGLSFVRDATRGNTKERRTTERHECPNAFPVLASATSPLFYREWLHFAVTEVSAGGMTLKTSIRNKGLLVGLCLDFTITLPLAGNFDVRGRITSIARDNRGGDDSTSSQTFVVGVAWENAPRELISAFGEYLLLGNKSLSPQRLRSGGFSVKNIERALTYDYARGEEDHKAILALRLKVHAHEPAFASMTPEAMASPFDAYARHVVCRFGGRIVGCGRLIFVGKDATKSQYISWGGHQAPDWMFEQGIVEAGACAIEPEFQGAGAFLPLMQHLSRIAAQSGHRFLLGGCDDNSLPIYLQMGAEVLEEREVEPRPGWKFRSYLAYLDFEKIIADPNARKATAGIAAAAVFGGMEDPKE